MKQKDVLNLQEKKWYIAQNIFTDSESIPLKIIYKKRIIPVIIQKYSSQEYSKKILSFCN